jgi:hypothetical protein
MILSMRIKPHRQVEFVLFMKLSPLLVIAEDMDRLKCIIMLCYFFSYDLFLLLVLL